MRSIRLCIEYKYNVGYGLYSIVKTYLNKRLILVRGEEEEISNNIRTKYLVLQHMNITRYMIRTRLEDGLAVKRSTMLGNC